MKHYHTIILGGGPSGLSCSYYLKQQGLDHMILEKNILNNGWRNERWDSFYLVTPNWMTNLPGMNDEKSFDNDFMSRDEVIGFMDEFIKKMDPPYIEHVEVEEITKEGDLFLFKTNKGSFSAHHLIVAVGMFNNPYIPPLHKDIPSYVNQLHASAYKNPATLKPGKSLVVGSGRSGIQIAYELAISGRDTMIALGSLHSLPTIYRGVNGVYWLNRLSGYDFNDTYVPYTEEDLKKAVIRDKLGQNLNKLQELGVEIIGRLIGAQGDHLIFKDNACQVINQGKDELKRMETVIDQHIEASSLSLVHENIIHQLDEFDVDHLTHRTRVDLDKEGFSNIIWCTGYRPDYSYIKLPVFNDRGEPLLKDGIEARVDKLYFCGMKLSPRAGEKSAFGVGLYAVGEAAKRVVNKIIGEESS